MAVTSGVTLNRFRRRHQRRLLSGFRMDADEQVFALKIDAGAVGLYAVGGTVRFKTSGLNLIHGVDNGKYRS